MSDDGALEVGVMMKLNQLDKQLRQMEQKTVQAVNKVEGVLTKINGKPFTDVAGKYAAAMTAMQSRVNVLTGVKVGFDGAANSARAFEVAMDQRDAVDRMRASLDPLYAASRRYESAVETLDAALASGAITGRQHAAMLDLVGRSYLQAAPNTAKMGGSLGILGKVSDGTKQKIQQVGFQVQDFAVQVGAGTSATQAFSQQFPQLAGAFGPVGVAIGTFAAVAVPLLVAAFGTAEAAGAGLDEQLSQLESAISSIDAITKAYTVGGLEELQQKYGQITEVIQGMITRQYEFAQQQAQASATAAVAELADQYGVLGINLDAIGPAGASVNAELTRMSHAMGITQSEAKTLVRAMQAAMNAKTPAELANALGRVDGVLGKSGEKASDLRGKLQQLEAAARQLAASGPLQSWMNGAIAGVNALIGRIGVAIAAKNKLIDKHGGVSNSLSQQYAQYGAGRASAEAMIGAGHGGASDTRSKWMDDNGFGGDAGSDGGGGGGGGGKEQSDPFDNGQEEIDQLQRKIEMLGKTDAQVAELTARYRMLEEAKKRGMDLDKVQIGSNMTLRDEIDAQAAAIGRLTEQYEFASEKAEFLGSMQDDLKNGFLDAVIEGENFSDTLKSVAKAIARAALEAAIFKTGPLAGLFRGGGGGGSGGLGGLLSGLFGRASGGSMQKGQAYRVNEPRSEVFVAPQNGAMLSVSQAQRAIAPTGNGGSSTVRVQVEGGDLVLTDSGQIAARIRVSEQRAMSGAVSAVKQSLPGWQENFAKDGTL